EFGKSDLFTVAELANVGVDLVIFPVSLLRLAMGAAEGALDHLAKTGTLKQLTGQMQTRAELYDLLDYQSYAQFDQSVFNFTL
ncbi:MAG: methylisocitrate lyase, partial [Bifidobacteriaceae bacterium]|nr:methylisocitrate lyase [Bifidobacteriaceae bacterium]